MYIDRLKDCFVLLHIAHTTAVDKKVKSQIEQVATRYKLIVKSNKKLTKKRLEKLEQYIEDVSTFNIPFVCKSGENLLKKV